MSRFYNYDIFLSCSYEDKKSAELLSRRLRDLDFHVWFAVPEVEKEEVFIQEMWEAIEDAPVCVLLLGSGATVPWVNDGVWSAIRCRLQRPHSTFRVVTVTLPQTNVYSAEKLTRLINPRFVSGRQPLTFIRFRESLDEEDTLGQLVAGIRGAYRSDESYFSNRLFKEQIQLRAENALNVDWHKLISDLRSTSFDLLAPREEICVGPNNLKSTISLKRIQRVKNRVSTVPPRKVMVQNIWQRCRSRNIGRSINSLNLNSHSAIAASMAILFVVLLGYWSWNRFAIEEVAQSGIPSHKLESSVSQIFVPDKPDDPISPKVVESAQSRKAALVRRQRQPHSSVVESIDHANYRPKASQADRNPDDYFVVNKRVFRGKGRSHFGFSLVHKSTGSNRQRSDLLLSSDDFETSSSSLQPSTSMTGSGKSRMLELTEVERTVDVEMPNKWERLSRSKLAAVKRIYVEVPQDTDLDDELKSRVVARFIMPLKEIGIEVFTQKEDKYRANGIVSLKFGPKEIKSGSVSVEYRENDQDIDSWVTPTLCEIPGEVLRIALCDASQRLGDKFANAITDAR